MAKFTMLMLAALAAAPAMIVGPDWAFPPGQRGSAEGKADPARIVRLPGAERTYSEAVVDGGAEAVDWRPRDHAPMPSIVARAAKVDGFACGYCHLPAGEGRPENASLAGLPAGYIVRQVEAMKSGERTGVRPSWVPTRLMLGVAKSVSPEDLRAAAAYFSRQQFTSRLRVVEAERIPTPTGAHFVYALARRGTAPLNHRIIEAPADPEAFEERDARMTYTAYVPAGAIARGAALARNGGPAARPCASCHGPNLTGGVGPPLAGRSPTYLFRQLLAFHNQARREPAAGDMQYVSAKLNQSDMINLAAYAANLKP